MSQTIEAQFTYLLYFSARLMSQTIEAQFTYLLYFSARLMSQTIEESLLKNYLLYQEQHRHNCVSILVSIKVSVFCKP